MERSKGLRGISSLSTVALCAALVTGLFASSAQAAVSIQVTQVRASNEGGESMDGAIDDALAARLKKLPYKNFKQVGQDTKQGDVNDKLDYALADGSTLQLTIVEIARSVVTMQAAVEGVINTRMRVRAGTPVMINLPWGKDVLVVAIMPKE